MHQDTLVSLGLTVNGVEHQSDTLKRVKTNLTFKYPCSSNIRHKQFPKQIFKLTT